MSTSTRKPSSHRRKVLREARLRQIASQPKTEACRKCSAPITSSWVFCRDCWTGMPQESKDAINAAFVPGTSLRGQESPAYWAAIDAACEATA